MRDIDKMRDNEGKNAGAEARSPVVAYPAKTRRRGGELRDRLGRFVMRIRPLIVFWLSFILLGYLCYLAAQAINSS